MTGTVFDTKRFAIHDGPGIRTTVFLKGCNLACRWCHNSEPIRREPELSFQSERCVDGGWCFEACPNGVHQWGDGRHVLERGKCQACGGCTERCYPQYLELIGQDMTVRAVNAAYPPLRPSVGASLTADRTCV
jgi:choline trimethylamine-lyase activating enzyme